MSVEVRELILTFIHDLESNDYFKVRDEVWPILEPYTLPTDPAEYIIHKLYGPLSAKADRGIEDSFRIELVNRLMFGPPAILQKLVEHSLLKGK